MFLGRAVQLLHFLKWGTRRSLLGMSKLMHSSIAILKSHLGCPISLFRASRGPYHTRLKHHWPCLWQWHCANALSSSNNVKDIFVRVCYPCFTSSWKMVPHPSCCKWYHLTYDEYLFIVWNSIFCGYFIDTEDSNELILCDIIGINLLRALFATINILQNFTTSAI